MKMHTTTSTRTKLSTRGAALVAQLIEKDRRSGSQLDFPAVCRGYCRVCCGC